MSEQEIALKDKHEMTQEESTRPGNTYRPDVDICESPDGLWLWADMPGVDEKSLNIHLADGVLTIEGQVDVADYKDLTPAYTEYNVGNFYRRFAISSDVDTDRISARLHNGVLELQLPKAERAKPRKIAVSAGG